MPIRKLSSLLINQIAAGEVIERPASVVKELIENSLDAGAKRLELIIEDGGRRLIRLADDGAGIGQDQLTLAVARHATSKLDPDGRLDQIQTLGFRGEALAAIASISRFRLTSRPTADGVADEAGWVLQAEGSRIGTPAPAACRPGTIVEVRDLFWNTPARRKFLRSAATEFGHIHDTVGRLAMIWPRAGFSLKHNGRVVLQVDAPQTRRQRATQILGPDLAEALVECERNEGDLGIWALLGLPAIDRATARFQYLFVNGRIVRDRNVAHAVKEAYRGLIRPDRHPLYTLALAVGSDQVDINVHPSKAEVRFAQPSEVHLAVLTSLRRRLLECDLTPSVANPVKLNGPDTPWAHGGAACATGPGNRQPASPWTGSTSAFIDSFQQMDPVQKGLVFDQVRHAMNSQPRQPDPPSLMAAVTKMQPILQVHNSYLVTQDDQGMLIVDQHALHERVMFEQLRDRLVKSDLESQRLLMPAVVPIAAGQMGLVEPLGPLLKRIGTTLEVIGPTMIAVQNFASFLFERNVDPVQFIGDLFERAADGQLGPLGNDRGAEEAALHEVLDMMACKAAVKAGDRLEPDELAALLDQRERVERSSACPHGRPTSIRLTLRDLARHFKRQ